MSCSAGSRHLPVTCACSPLTLTLTLTLMHLLSSSLNPLPDQSSPSSYAGPLANALQCNTTLTALNLGNNDMGEMGGMALAQALAMNTTLMALSLA